MSGYSAVSYQLVIEVPAAVRCAVGRLSDFRPPGGGTNARQRPRAGAAKAARVRKRKNVRNMALQSTITRFAATGLHRRA
jgi:hypothetical protein